MILRLLHAGTAARGPLGAAADDYRERLARHTRCEEVFVKPSKQKTPAAALRDEGDRLRAAVRPRERLVALTPAGEPWSSEHLATRLAAWMMGGEPAICFLLGSADGLDEPLIRDAAERWSFGPLTLPHDLARVVLWEQLYRASSILRGEPYHRADQVR
ncbi:MAG: 23S rRNA (pseudouridine(1915)-N(3))-methyltransferase RlmH [Myxococcales bacterium]|nr:23S rRNA (pseudouridine(1915)-N(3))-methyltransferase RlmH [Myxococcales bacterium]MCB9732897.1 23S rRNA (pseudouridine(1915)-N(3))-methyltransferase RlmH [Deltaproteobacteria bacterium]